MSTPPEPSTLKFPCKSCGADLEFQVGAANLTCPYCQYSEAIPVSAEQVMELDFESFASQTLPHGWGTALKDLKCDACGAAFHIEPHVTSADCPFCGSSQVEERASDPDSLQPQSLVPFQVSREDMQAAFKTWLAGLWFRPNALRAAAVSEGMRGVYIPYWTFDTLTNSFWQAEAGFHYYETETYQERDAQGNSQTRTRQVRRTRWQWVSGQHSAFFDDVLIPASHGVDRKLAKKIAFDTKQLVPYQPHYLVGLGAEDYQLDLQEAWPEAQAHIDAEVRRACARMVPGDTHRSLSVRTSYNNRTFKLCLLPLWIATYRFGDKRYRYLGNGQTGQVVGEAPISWPKVLTLVATIAILITLIILLAQ